MTINERVTKGIEWLDSVSKTWRKKVSPGILQMENFLLCVLGQAGLWIKAERSALIAQESPNKKDKWYLDHGFEAKFTTSKKYLEACESLRKAWVKRLKEGVET